MDIAELYRRKAEDLERLAVHATDRIESAGFRVLAAFWRELEAEAGRGSPYASSSMSQ